MKIRKIFIAFLIAISIQNSGAVNDLYFSKIGIEEGLSQLSVNSMYQDELGAIWFATREGLNRYNGNGMDVFRSEPNDSNSLGENLILTVTGDKNGHIFIRTQAGINAFDYCVGRVMHTLDSLGITENTIIVLTSDNGPVLDDGYHDQAVELLGNHTPAGAFRGGKYSIFEAGTRVPCIVKWEKK